MKVPRRFAIITVASIGCSLIGCFSYTKKVQPSPAVVETVPGDPTTTTESTTTTDQNGVVKRQTSTTYTNP